MAFLNPILLMGTLAVAIPIIIHILNKRKFEKVTWAAMRFLLTSIEKNQRRLRLEDLLLLLLRCALLAILALALARPALKSSSAAGLFGQAKISAVAVLDNSYSMCQTDGVSTRFARAKEGLEQAIDTLPAGSSVSVILASDISEAAIAEPTFDLNLARKTVADAHLCDRGTNLLPAVADAIDILKRQNSLRRELFLATDGQAAGFSQMDDLTRDLDSVHDDIKCHILLCGQTETRNLSVSALTMGSDIPAVGSLHPFDAEITNWGQQDESDVHVTLSIDGEQPSAEGVLDKISPGQSRVISLATRINDAGYHIATAALPVDHLPADDSRTIAFRGVSRINVLLVDGNPGTEPRDSEVFFLRRALAPIAHIQATNYLVQCNTIAPAELESQKPGDFRVIVLANVADLDDKAVELLTGFVRGGGGLWIFPGENSLPAFYNDRLLVRAALLPAQLLPARGNASDESKFLQLSGKDLQHPIVAVWNDVQSGGVGAAHFFRSFTLKPIDKPNAAVVDSESPQVILSFTDGTPYMVERQFGLGRVIQFASTASTRWNNLPDHPGLFVPLLYRTLGWTVLQQDRQLNIAVGQRLVLHPDLSDLNKEALVTQPPASGAGRDSRHIEMDANNLATMTFEDTRYSGGYTVQIPGEPAIRFAVQSDKAESILADLSENQRQKLAESAIVIDWHSGLDLKAALEKERVGSELWQTLAIAVVVIALGESLLADWFSRPK